MKNTKQCGFIGFFAATVLASASSTRLWAQTALTAAVPQTATTEQWQKIQLHNVGPNFMAYWLDSKNHTVIAPLQGVKPTWAIGKTTKEIAEMLSLPADVRAVAPVNASSSLWVLGTAEGIQKVVEKVTLLDRLLRQVEVEAQVVQISAADAKKLGIDFTKSQSKIEVSLAGANFGGQIKALVAQNKAKVLTAPRVNALFGATSSLTTTGIIPVNIGVQLDKQYNLKIRQVDKAAQPGIYRIGVSSSLGLVVTPTINPDGTTSLQMGPIRTIGLTDYKLSGDIPKNSILLADLDQIPTQPITLSDDQTAVLQGLKWPISSKGFVPYNPAATPDVNVLVLVTAHIIHHAHEEEMRTAVLPR